LPRFFDAQSSELESVQKNNYCVEKSASIVSQTSTQKPGVKSGRYGPPHIGRIRFEHEAGVEAARVACEQSVVNHPAAEEN
jgi:hypothetical protein